MYTSCNLNTMKLLDCALIRVCSVIRLNMVSIKMKPPQKFWTALHSPRKGSYFHLIKIVIFSRKTLLVYIRSTTKWGASNEYPHIMFLWRYKKNIMWISLLSRAITFSNTVSPVSEKKGHSPKNSWISHCVVHIIEKISIKWFACIPQ